MLNNTEVPDAMTAEEWAELAQPWDGGKTRGETYRSWCVLETQLDPRAIAALCLHGQPFGFTATDVKFLRWLRGCFGTHDGKQFDIDLDGIAADEVERLTTLADRIEALLPPE